LTLGRAIREARQRLGLSQETVAAKARIGRSYLSLLENDAKSPTVKVFLRVCAAMGVSGAEVLRDVERGRSTENRQ
jgi:transcriptional regulator with XRE-family HTH domain